MFWTRLLSNLCVQTPLLMNFFVVIWWQCVEFHCLCTNLLIFAFELLPWICPNFNFQFHHSFAVRDSWMNKRWKICWLRFLPLWILHFSKLSQERFVHLYLCSSDIFRVQKWQYKVEGNGQYWGQLGVHKIDYEFQGKDQSSVSISACCSEAGVLCRIKVWVKQPLFL